MRSPYATSPPQSPGIRASVVSKNYEGSSDEIDEFLDDQRLDGSYRQISERRPQPLDGGYRRIRERRRQPLHGREQNAEDVRKRNEKQTTEGSQSSGDCAGGDHRVRLVGPPDRSGEQTGDERREHPDEYRDRHEPAS